MSVVPGNSQEINLQVSKTCVGRDKQSNIYAKLWQGPNPPGWPAGAAGLAWLPDWVVKMRFLRGALEGKFLLLSRLSHWSVEPVPEALRSVSGTRWLSEVLKQHRLRLLPVKSLSISFLSLSESTCPEEAEILYKTWKLPEDAYSSHCSREVGKLQLDN